MALTPAPTPVPTGPAINLVDFIYSAMGDKHHQHHRWASASSASASPSASVSVVNDFTSATNFTRKWANNQNQTDPDLAVCQSTYTSLNNDKGQDPCLVARQLIDICQFGQSTNRYQLTPFQNDVKAYPSLLESQATNCACTTPVYNLVAGCAACQLNQNDQTSMGWRTWSKNCTNQPENGLDAWPYPVPAWTAIPDWAMTNLTTEGYAFDLQQAFAVSQNKSIANTNFTSVYPTYTTTATSASASSTPTGQSAGGMTDAQKHHRSKSTFVSIIAGTVVTTLAVTAIVTALTWWLLRKRRAARQGVRLTSSSDLNDKDEGFRQGGAAFAQREMSQKGGNGRSHVSLFVPTESSFFTESRRASTTSFGTNSVSSRSYSESEFTEDASLMSMDEDDIDGESVSPFSNAHRAPSVRTSISLTPPGQARFASRNNLHNRESGSTWMTTETGRLVQTGRRGQAHLAPDARSLLSMAPSSTGATWGREADEQDHREEDEDESGSSDGDDDYERRFQARESTISLSGP